MSLTQLKKEMQSLANPQKAKLLSGFFKTGKGQYGEGDVFLGITVPQSRLVARKYASFSLADLSILLSSPIHEHRLVALLIAVHQFEKGDDTKKKEIYTFYWKNAKRVNNWDLVDLTAPRIVGRYLFDKDRSLLYKLASSSNLWEKRISIVSTLYFIVHKDFKDTLTIAELLMNDKHDLIHKASGWMLREMGKRDEKPLLQFLNKHAKRMPRTMLRYSIERLTPSQKKEYMQR